MSTKITTCDKCKSTNIKELNPENREKKYNMKEDYKNKMIDKSRYSVVNIVEG